MQLLIDFLPKPPAWQLFPAVAQGWHHNANYVQVFDAAHPWSCRAGGGVYRSSIHSANPGACNANLVNVTKVAYEANLNTFSSTGYITGRSTIPHPTFGVNFVRIDNSRRYVRINPELPHVAPEYVPVAIPAFVVSPIIVPNVWRDPWSAPINVPVVAPKPQPGRQEPNPELDPVEQPHKGPRPAARPGRLIQFSNRAMPGARKATNPNRGFPKPPGRLTKETKMTGNLKWGRLVFQIFNQVTEVGDVVESFYDALPKPWKIKRGTSPFEGKLGATKRKAWQVWKHFDQMDVTEAFKNLVINEIEDQIIGRMIGKNRRAMRVSFRGAEAIFSLGKKL